MACLRGYVGDYTAIGVIGTVFAARRARRLLGVSVSRGQGFNNFQYAQLENDREARWFSLVNAGLRLGDESRSHVGRSSGAKLTGWERLELSPGQCT